MIVWPSARPGYMSIARDPRSSRLLSFEGIQVQCHQVLGSRFRDPDQRSMGAKSTYGTSAVIVCLKIVNCDAQKGYHTAALVFVMSVT